MIKPYLNNVSLSNIFKSIPGSCRRGTVFISLSEFGRKFGDPHISNFSNDGVHGDEKIHAMWTVDTPRGPVNIYDYWWNPKAQLSIGAKDKYSFLWCKGWLKMHGVECKSGNGK